MSAKGFRQQNVARQRLLAAKICRRDTDALPVVVRNGGARRADFVLTPPAAYPAPGYRPLLRMIEAITPVATAARMYWPFDSRHS